MVHNSPKGIAQYIKGDIPSCLTVADSERLIWWGERGKRIDMPVVLRLKGYSFFFFSNEGKPPEPPHIHVRRGGARAKFWLTSVVSLASSYDLSGPELNELTRMVLENKELFEGAWHEHIGKIR